MAPIATSRSTPSRRCPSRQELPSRRPTSSLRSTTTSTPSTSRSPLSKAVKSHSFRLHDQLVQLRLCLPISILKYVCYDQVDVMNFNFKWKQQGVLQSSQRISANRKLVESIENFKKYFPQGEAKNEKSFLVCGRLFDLSEILIKIKLDDHLVFKIRTFESY